MGFLSLSPNSARSPQIVRKNRPCVKFIRGHDVNFGCRSVNVYWP